ncbi:MAG: hypothetical protein BA867_03810 [Desulfobacterales bacterium S5133MH16]|jgi:hypothetical protein|nr:MAG: hypothetical protein BA867_03810 [Desulfobacterales bacterium S5133MH16]
MVPRSTKYYEIDFGAGPGPPVIDPVRQKAVSENRGGKDYSSLFSISSTKTTTPDNSDFIF